MPISVEYQPPLSAIADASYEAGLGDWIKHQQALGLQQAQMAQQAQIQQQHLAAQLYSQNQAQLANQNSQLFHAQQQNAQNQFNKGFEYDRLNWQRDNAQQDWDRNRQAHLEDLDSQRQWEVDKQPMVWGFQAATRSGEDLEKEIYTGLTQFAKQRPYMTPEGVNALNDLQGKFRAIQKVRDFARPEQYAQALGQFQGDVARADIPQHINTPKTVQEEVEAQGGAYQQPVHSPEGEFMGYHTWYRNRNGVLQPKFVPHRPDPQSAMMNATTPEQYWNALKPSEQHAIYGAVSKELMGDNTDAAAPPPEKVMQAVQERIAAMRGMAMPEQQPAASQPPADPEAVAKAQAIQQQRRQWEQANGVTGWNGNQPQFGPQQGGQQPQAMKPAKVDELPKAARQMAEKHYAKPTSKAERDKLPPGVAYIAPDGTIHVTPMPQSFGVTGAW